MAEMSRPEALAMLQNSLEERQTRDDTSTGDLLDFLADLPLAIKQASAYMAKTESTAAQYLAYCRSSDKSTVDLLSNEFEDRTRYENLRNPIATTWLVSFEHISRDNPLAAQYLRFMCFLAEKAIPKSLLPTDDEMAADEAIGTLRGYAFINEQGKPGLFDMHRLV